MAFHLESFTCSYESVLCIRKPEPSLAHPLNRDFAPLHVCVHLHALTAQSRFVSSLLAILSSMLVA